MGKDMNDSDVEWIIDEVEKENELSVPLSLKPIARYIIKLIYDAPVEKMAAHHILIGGSQKGEIDVFLDIIEKALREIKLCEPYYSGNKDCRHKCNEKIAEIFKIKRKRPHEGYDIRILGMYEYFILERLQNFPDKDTELLEEVMDNTRVVATYYRKFKQLSEEIEELFPIKINLDEKKTTLDEQTEPSQLEDLTGSSTISGLGAGNEDVSEVKTNNKYYETWPKITIAVRARGRKIGEKQLQRHASTGILKVIKLDRVTVFTVINTRL